MSEPSHKGVTYLRIYLSALAFMIAVVIGLHIFWQAVLFVSGTENIVVIDIAGRFNLDYELSVPTWVASFLAFNAAIGALVIGFSQKNARKKATWFILAAIAMAVSVDETAALHELLLQGLHLGAGLGEQQTFAMNAWLLVIPFILLGLIMLLRTVYANVPRDTFIRIAAAGGVYLLGALIVEYLSIEADKTAPYYIFGLVVVEEGLELVGVWLAIRALGLHIVHHERSLRNALTSASSA
jgi:hypothetical protein